MKLRGKTLSDLAEMITGGPGSIGFFSSSKPVEEPQVFPYRSGPDLTRFFENCDLDYEHSGSRIPWVRDVLKELNEGPASQPDLPADSLVRMIQELMDPVDFERSSKNRQHALVGLNKSIGRDGLEAFLDETGLCQLRAGNVTSAGRVKEGGWSQAELERRARWELYLGTASEDDFTENALAPLLRKCGFQSVHLAGHTGEITKMAEQFLANSLDLSMRKDVALHGTFKALGSNLRAARSKYPLPSDRKARCPEPADNLRKTLRTGLPRRPASLSGLRLAALLHDNSARKVDHG